MIDGIFIALIIALLLAVAMAASGLLMLWYLLVSRAGDWLWPRRTAPPTERAGD